MVTSAKALVTEMKDARDDGDDEKGETIRAALEKMLVKARKSERVVIQHEQMAQIHADDVCDPTMTETVKEDNRILRALTKKRSLTMTTVKVPTTQSEMTQLEGDIKFLKIWLNRYQKLKEVSDVHLT